MKAALMAMVLSGCAVFIEPVPEHVYQWEKVGPALPASEHLIPQQAVQEYCNTTDFYVMACAYRDHEHCWIFSSSTHHMQMMRSHEQRHCDGYDHQVLRRTA